MKDNESLHIDDIANHLIVIPKGVFDLFLKEENPSELFALYGFYYYTAKWQKTNQPKASTGYTSKGLHWGRDKVRKVKGDLVKLGLLRDIKDIDEKTHKIKGWYIQLGYIMKNENVKTTLLKTHEGGNPHRVDLATTNALSDSSLNALSDSTNFTAHRNDPVLLTNHLNTVEETNQNPPSSASPSHGYHTEITTYYCNKLKDKGLYDKDAYKLIAGKIGSTIKRLIKAISDIDKIKGMIDSFFVSDFGQKCGFDLSLMANTPTAYLTKSKPTEKDWLADKEKSRIENAKNGMDLI